MNLVIFEKRENDILVKSEKVYLANAYLLIFECVCISITLYLYREKVVRIYREM